MAFLPSQSHPTLENIGRSSLSSIPHLEGREARRRLPSPVDTTHCNGGTTYHLLQRTPVPPFQQRTTRIKTSPISSQFHLSLRFSRSQRLPTRGSLTITGRGPGFTWDIRLRIHLSSLLFYSPKSSACSNPLPPYNLAVPAFCCPHRRTVSMPPVFSSATSIRMSEATLTGAFRAMRHFRGLTNSYYFPSPP